MFACLFDMRDLIAGLSQAHNTYLPPWPSDITVMPAVTDRGLALKQLAELQALMYPLKTKGRPFRDQRMPMSRDLGKPGKQGDETLALPSMAYKPE